MVKIANLIYFLALILCFLALQTHSSYAATITVDDSAGCSIRDAIVSANSDTAVNNCTAGSGSDTLALSNLSYDVSSSSLSVTSEITVEGVSGSIISKDASTGLAHRLFTLSGSSASLTINNVEIYGDYTYSISDSGGCFYVDSNTSLTLQNSFVELCLSDTDGGAIYVASGAQATLINSVVNNNIALTNGGGIYSAGTLSISSTSRISSNNGSLGGGIYLENSLASLSVEQSSIIYNEALSGGGIYATSTSSITLSNSTISENLATGGKAPNFGGGFFLSSSEAQINNCTIAYNSAEDLAGGVYAISSSFTMDNSIIAGNLLNTGGLASEIYLAPASTFVSESFLTATPNNLLGDSSNTNADAFSGYTPSSKLISATSDGSLPTGISAIMSAAIKHTTSDDQETFAHGLAANSPALDAGNYSSCENNDQRGFPRETSGLFFPIDSSSGAIAVIHLDGDCDLGAYED